MGLPWYKSDPGLPRHPKTRRLSRQIAQIYPGAPAELIAGGILQTLHAYAATYALDGALPAADDGEGWAVILDLPDAEATRIRDALIQVGFVDRRDGGGCELHDWSAWQEAHVRRRERDAEAKALSRRRRTDVRPDPEGRSGDVGTTSARRRHDVVLDVARGGDGDARAPTAPRAHPRDNDTTSERVGAVAERARAVEPSSESAPQAGSRVVGTTSARRRADVPPLEGEGDGDGEGEDTMRAPPRVRERASAHARGGATDPAEAAGAGALTRSRSSSSIPETRLELDPQELDPQEPEPPDGPPPDLEELEEPELIPDAGARPRGGGRRRRGDPRRDPHVLEVWELWRTESGHLRAVLDEARAKKILARIDRFGLDGARRIVTHVCASAFHRDGRYTTWETSPLCDERKCEGWLDPPPAPVARSGGRPAPLTAAQIEQIAAEACGGAS